MIWPALIFQQRNSIIPSLTVDKRKNRCIPHIYWVTAILAVVSNYSNLFFPLTFFLDVSHFTFRYELIVCPKTKGLVKIICDGFPLIQWDKSLFLYLSKIHCFQGVQQFLTSVFQIQLFLKITLDG